jgi:hypothetical protein
MRRRYALFAFVLWSVADSGSADNILVNGGFEEPTVPDVPIHATHRNGSELTGWTAFSSYRGIVQFTDLYNPVSDGSQAVQLEVPGDWISQSFSTVAGETYTLSFDLSAYTGSPGILEVAMGPARATVAGTSAGYLRHTLKFIADASVTTLRLQNPSVPATIGNYPQVDNVVVERTLSNAIDHFQCYAAKGEVPEEYVDLKDQFGTATVFVGAPEFLCNPVDKNGEGTRNPVAHLTCYKIKAKGAKREVSVENEFGSQPLDLKDPELLCVPSNKIEVRQ